MDNNPNVVNEEPTIPEGSHPEPVSEQEEVLETAPGTKTPPDLLLKSLQEEREKRRLLEEEIEQFKSSTIPDSDVFSDEGKVLKKDISLLESKINSLEEERTLDKLYIQYPLLKDKADEFREFRKSEHPRAKIESVAKLFLAENDLLAQTPRKGLEKPTGGSREPIPVGMTIEDQENLRKTDFRKYKEMLMQGKL